MKNSNLPNRKLLINTKNLIDISIKDNNRKKYTNFINSLIPYLNLLIKTNSVSKEIKNFKKGIDNFFQYWV